MLGVGLGLTASPTLVAVQSVIGWDRRGMVTGANMFSRSLGSAVGAAVFGAIANATLADRFTHPPPEIGGNLPDHVDTTSLVLGGHSQSAQPAVTDYVRATYRTHVASRRLAGTAASARTHRVLQRVRPRLGRHRRDEHGLGRSGEHLVHDAPTRANVRASMRPRSRWALQPAVRPESWF